MYTLEQIHKVFIEKGYKLHMDYWYPNLIGVRNTDDVNEFNDTLILIQHTPDGVKYREYPITTDPGTYWLNNPLATDGCAIVVPDYYKNLWTLGTHKGYKALVQSGKIKVYRDNNKDDVLDCDPLTAESGYFGINLHRSNPYDKSYYVNKWSAGCQVFQKLTDFEEVIDIATRSGVLRFDYYLLDKSDFK